MTAYHALPPGARSLAASLRGLYLSRWRFGPETDRLVDEALERDRWSDGQWTAWREDALARLLDRAATRVPYYRDLWAKRRAAGDRRAWDVLANWPTLPKQVLRERPESFVADDCDRRRMFEERTSGTSGTPLRLWWTRETVRRWYALYEARIREWNGVGRRDRWAMLGGQPVVPASAQRPPFWVVNRPMRQMYMSANHISRANGGDYRRALARYGPTHMIAYASSATLLAQVFESLGDGPRLPLVITNAEPLFPWQREQMLRSLAERVRETYGMAEIVAAASECDAGALHLWPDVGILEAHADAEAIPAVHGQTGQFVSTGLINQDMPLIRYEVGDRGSLAHTSACSCGRTLPRLATVEGRTNDVLIGTNGRFVYWVNPIFYGMPVREAQIVQESVARIVIRVVPGSGFSASSRQVIAGRARERLGDLAVVFDEVDAIPRGSNGKFRAVVCAIPPEERAGALRAPVAP